MKTHLYISLGMSIMLLTAFTAAAEEAYAPAEYKPIVEYLAPENIAMSAKAGIPETTGEPLVTAEQPHAPKPESAKPITPSAEKNSTAESSPPPQVGDMQSREPKSYGKNILYFSVLAVAAAMLFRKKIPSGNVVPDSIPNSSATTGVERYIEKLAPQKTGVAKYLERQSGTIPSTGVAKYLAKQAAKDRERN